MGQTGLLKFDDESSIRLTMTAIFNTTPNLKSLVIFNGSDIEYNIERMNAADIKFTNSDLKTNFKIKEIINSEWYKSNVDSSAIDETILSKIDIELRYEGKKIFINQDLSNSLKSQPSNNFEIIKNKMPFANLTKADHWQGCADEPSRE